MDTKRSPSSPTHSFQFTKIPEERFNTASHFIGGILALIGTLFLVLRSVGHPTRLTVSLIYGFSNTMLFFSSTICHSQKMGDDRPTVWTTLDQAAIFIMIAGTYTPIAVLYLPTPWTIGILLGQWLFAGLGILLKLFIRESPRWINAVIYIIQGWMIILAVGILIQTVSLGDLILIFGGGILYTVGATFYVTKKPKLKPGIFGAHELWHTFVLLGALCFYIVIYRAI